MLKLHPKSSSPPGLLYPFSCVGGPNNQYRQLLEAALAAKASGRAAFVLPPFVKWNRDQSSRYAYNFSSTFDAAALSRFVPTVPVRGFRFSDIGAVVSAGHNPSAGLFRTLCFAAEARCDGTALKARVVYAATSAQRCKAQPRGTAFVRCLLTPWNRHSAVGYAGWQKLAPYWGGLLTPVTRQLYASLRRAPGARSSSSPTQISRDQPRCSRE